MRLGEYDVSTTTDGKHQDIDIVHAVKHEQYIKNAGIDDIAMVYLKKHVEFNGKMRDNAFDLREDVLNFNVVFFFSISGYQIVSVQFVYLTLKRCKNVAL